MATACRSPAWKWRAGRSSTTRISDTCPNITPDPETGIGRWTQAQIVNAIRNGCGQTDDHRPADAVLGL
jgi:hypothetical protein